MRVSDEEVHSEDDLGELCPTSGSGQQPRKKMQRLLSISFTTHNIENAINDDFRISRDLSLALRQRENDRIRSP